MVKRARAMDLAPQQAARRAIPSGRVSRPSGGGRGGRRRWVHLVLYAVLAAATLVVYTPALNHSFVNFDDPQYVLENPQVRAGLTWKGAAWALTATNAGNWHPMTWLSHMADVELHGLNPRGHHATSVLIHLLNTLLLFALLCRMTGEPVPSAIVAGLFGVHPLHVESVAWIAERKDVLSTLFALLTLRAYVHYVEGRSRGRYLLMFLCFVLGLAAKPMLVTLPLLLLLLDIWPLGRISRADGARLRGANLLQSPAFRALVREKIPLLICTLASSVLTFVVQQSAGAVRAFDALPLGRRLANAVVAYVAYIGRTVWPVNLAPLYPYAASESLSRVAPAAALLLTLTVLALRAGPRARYVTVGWFWFLGTLVPVIGLVQVGSQPMADRYTYLPVVGLFIIFAWGLSDLLRRWPARHVLLPVIMSAVVLPTLILARRQVSVWENSVKLWEHTLRVTHNNYRAHGNLAHAVAAAGRGEEAIAHYYAALRINPDSPDARNGLGGALAAAGRLDEAIHHYQHALRVDSGYATAQANLGAALATRGRLNEAEEHLRKAVRLAPDLASAHSNLGITVARMGRTAEAVEHFATAVGLQPNDGAAHRHFGSALATEGRTDEAIARLEEAVRLDPDDTLARNALGAVLAGSGNLEAAVVQYDKAVRLNPAFAEARANLGNTLARLGRSDEALVHLFEAVRIRPDDTEARYDLAVVLWKQGRIRDARQQLDTLLSRDPGHEAARQMLLDLRKVDASSLPPESEG